MEKSRKKRDEKCKSDQKNGEQMCSENFYNFFISKGCDITTVKGRESSGRKLSDPLIEER
jgi:hypothetical protein